MKYDPSILNLGLNKIRFRFDKRNKPDDNTIFNTVLKYHLIEFLKESLNELSNFDEESKWFRSCERSIQCHIMSTLTKFRFTDIVNIMDGSDLYDCIKSTLENFKTVCKSTNGSENWKDIQTTNINNELDRLINGDVELFSLSSFTKN